MRACKRCCHGDNAIDPNGQPFVLCRLMPPLQLIVPNGSEVVQRVPQMKPFGYCGQFRLRLWKLMFSRATRTTG